MGNTNRSAGSAAPLKISRAVCEIIEGDFCELMFVRVADHASYARQRGDFCGSALRVASGDDDFCLRAVAMDAADEGTGAAIGIRRHAAGIDDNDICASKISGGTETAAAQPCGDRFAVGSAGSASKVLDMVFCHVV